MRPGWQRARPALLGNPAALQFALGPWPWRFSQKLRGQIMFLILMGAILAVMPPIANFLLLTSSYVRDRSQADFRAAQWAERMSAHIDRVQTGNRMLRNLKETCLSGAGALPPAQEALVAAGLAALTEQ